MKKKFKGMLLLIATLLPTVMFGNRATLPVPLMELLGNVGQTVQLQ